MRDNERLNEREREIMRVREGDEETEIVNNQICLSFSWLEQMGSHEAAVKRIKFLYNHYHNSVSTIISHLPVQSQNLCHLQIAKTFTANAPEHSENL